MRRTLSRECAHGENGEQMKTYGKAVALGVALLTSAATTTAAASPPPTAGITLEWFDHTRDALAATPNQGPLAAERTWAISWLAGAEATRSPGVAAHQREAAFAAAVHQSLVTLLPGRTAELDRAFTATLSRFPRDAARDSAVAEGRRQAREVIAARAADGLDPGSLARPVSLPAAAPGVWRPTPNGHLPAVLGGLSSATPFALDRADRFRPAPPPALDSPRYRADLAEVRYRGAAAHSTRSAAQTAVATFWVGPNYPVVVQGLRAALAANRTSTTKCAALVAVFFMAEIDTSIATFDAKYAYALWRPVTALREQGLTGWSPLHETPAHPDYPAAHASYAGSAEQVLTAFTGPFTPGAIRVSSPTAPSADRVYTAWQQFSSENVDARVWSGVHTRVAGEAGATLGRRVAAHVIAQYSWLLR